MNARMMWAGVLAVAGMSQAAATFVPLDLRQVQLQGEMGRRIAITARNNLLVLDADKDFLLPFRERKGTAGGYIGLGKLIDSAVLLAVVTGDPEVLARKNHLVEQVLAHQEPGGYLGLFPAEKRVAELWDVHETQYIVWGLLEDSRWFGSARSLEAARRGADFLLENWSKIPAGWGEESGVAPHVAVTGLERTLVALYQATQDRKYLDFVLRQRRLGEWDLPIVVGRRRGIEGHIYAYLARCLAQQELRGALPESLAEEGRDLDRCSLRALDFMTRGGGLLITGGCGQWEIWTNDQDGRGELGETCATAYQLRLYLAMLRRQGWEGGYWGDLMERTIYNALFAAQSPEGRRLRYFSPTEGPRVYHPTDTYCCPCNFRRIVAELPGLAYFREGETVAVNLYGASRAECGLLGGTAVRLRQETDYPSSGKVTLCVDPEREARFTVALRVPLWAKGARLRLPDGGNGDEWVRQAGFARIERLWKPGDRLVLDFPMDVRLIQGRQRQAGRVAAMRGPLVFCLDPAQQKSLGSLDGADLSRVTLRPETFRVEPDGTVRPGGVALRVEAWKPSFGLGEKGDFELLLREFPDPAGRQTYFRLRQGTGVPDELLTGP